MSPAGRTMAVTGGARGVDAAVARFARQQGAHVAVLERTPAPDADRYVECDTVSDAVALHTARDALSRQGPACACTRWRLLARRSGM